MERSNQLPSINDHQRLNQPADQRDKKKKWVIPLALLLIIAAAFAVYLLLDPITPREETLHITMPKAIFTGKDLPELESALLEEDLVESITEDDAYTVTFTLSNRKLQILLEKTESSLLQNIDAIKIGQQHPYIADIRYNEQYSDFSLTVNAGSGQIDQALLTASGLFMEGLYYHYLAADLNSAINLTVTIEEAGSGNIIDNLTYPGDLSRASEIISRPDELAMARRTPQAGDIVVVSTGPDNLNLRNGPEITYLIIAILNSGTILEVTGTDGVWLEVITPDGQEGWVHGNFVEFYLED